MYIFKVLVSETQFCQLILSLKVEPHLHKYDDVILTLCFMRNDYMVKMEKHMKFGLSGTFGS